MRRSHTRGRQHASQPQPRHPEPRPHSFKGTQVNKFINKERGAEIGGRVERTTDRREEGMTDTGG